MPGNSLIVLIVLAVVAVLCWMAFQYGRQRGLHSRHDEHEAHFGSVDNGANQLVDLEVGRDLQSNLEWLPDAIMVLDNTMKLNWANKTAEEWFGFNLEHHVQMKITSILNDRAICDYLSNRNFSDPFECAAPGIPEIHVRIRVVPYRHGQYLLQARDVTQVRVLEKVRRDFVANASHELRTPISILYGYLEMMMQDNEQGISREWKAAVKQMHGQTIRVKQIIEDMMILSRLEDPESTEEHEPVEMHPLLVSACENAKILSGNRKQKIKADILDQNILICNQKEIESLVANLVSNAVHYTPDKGSITIRWSSDLSGGTLSVTDTGIGIDPADIPRITERFYRTDSARSRETGGTGLGLAIVNHIVQRHQATLIVDSKPEKGSTFTVAFPLDRIKNSKAQKGLLLN